MMRGMFEGWHIVILAVLLIALFGAKRLPDAARSLGRSARVFRSEVEEMKKEAREAPPATTAPTSRSWAEAPVPPTTPATPADPTVPVVTPDVPAADRPAT